MSDVERQEPRKRCAHCAGGMMMNSATVGRPICDMCGRDERGCVCVPNSTLEVLGMQQENAALRAEVARLTAENERLLDGNTWMLSRNIDLSNELESKDAQLATLTERLAAAEGKPKDWRIGLTVKPRLRSDELYYERGIVTDVLENGYSGIDDKDGVLCIRMNSGNVILRPAGDWITA